MVPVHGSSGSLIGNIGPACNLLLMFFGGIYVINLDTIPPLQNYSIWHKVLRLLHTI